MDENKQKVEKIAFPETTDDGPVLTFVDDLSKFYLALYVSKMNLYIYALVAIGHMRTRVNLRPEMHMYVFDTNAQRDQYHNALNQFMAYQHTEPAWDRWGRDLFSDDIAEFYDRMRKLDQAVKTK